MVSIYAMQGLERVDAATGEVTLRHGTRISAAAALVAPYGLALPNMGDIDRQTLAGALAISSH